MNCSFSFTFSLVASLLLHGAVLAGLVGLAGYGSQPGAGNGIEGIGVSFISLDAGEGGTGVSAETAPAVQPAAHEVPPEPEEPEVSLENKARVVKQPQIRREQGAKTPRKAESASMQQLSAETCQPGTPGAGTDGSGSGSGAAGGNIFGVQGGTGAIRAIPIRAPKPPYPYQARQAGFEGQVTLEVLVSEEGSVKNASIARSSSRPDCDESALRTILERWRFEPASLNGRSIEWREKVVVSYKLR